MQASEVDEEGWVVWKPLPGTLSEDDYRKIEEEYNVRFPKSFVDWHKAYFFLDGDCSLLRLPVSSPTQPLEDLKQALSWHVPERLIPQGLYPFAGEGNDTGPLVFDGRMPVADNEFPIRVYDHEHGGDLAGLSEIIFSSFAKLLECITHYLNELKSRKAFEIIPDFFEIDPGGAGSSGREYWLSWVAMRKTDD